MPRAWMVTPLALLGGAAIVGTLAFTHHAPSLGKTANSAASARVLAAPVASVAASPLSSSPAVASSLFGALPPLRFSNENTRRSANIELYDSSGRVNESEAARLDSLLCDTRDPNAWATLALDRRTLQLTVRAALHFHVAEVEVVSAYRKPGRRREGLHASGKAIDFKLPGVAARALAAYLRTLPRVGVGVYTHPKTGYVHLDDREHSFHWLDASPPGRSWREQSIGNASLGKRDAAYTRADDWPEGTRPPEDAH